MSAGDGGSRPLYKLSSATQPTREAKLYCMGPDYANVVTACAAHLWLQPLYLHRAVVELENAMSALESTAGDGEVNVEVTAIPPALSLPFLTVHMFLISLPPCHTQK